jgi:manganese transport protein
VNYVTGVKGKPHAIAAYLVYFGPALLAAVAYIDPGNFGTDILAGSRYGYVLLWSVLVANLMGILLQYLSGKVGIATDHSLAELIRGSLKTRWKVIPYWLASEVFAVFTDLAEFLGVTSAIYLLSNHRVPLLISAWIAAFDVIVIFALTGKKFRRIEMLITVFVFGIGLGYFYEIFLAKPNTIAVATGLAFPTITNSNQLFLVVGIIGATVMPHALILQSWLTKGKLVKNEEDEKKQLLRLHRWDTIGNLAVAGLINMAILIMASAAFHTAGLKVATVDEAYKTLTPLFGISASIVFGVTLLFSGWSSSVVGVLAGQSILEGLLGSKFNPWVRRIILRGINVVPTSVAITLGFDPLLILVYSQVVLSLLIPLPLIPLIYYTSRRKVMGQFANCLMVTILALITAGIIVALNILLLASFV